MNNKINCHNIKHILQNNHYIAGTYPTLEVLEDIVLKDKLILDKRTYICANKLCNLSHKKSHYRISKYNHNKIKNNRTNTNTINDIIKIAQNLITSSTKDEYIKTSNKTIKSGNKCNDCDIARHRGNIHIHFIKSSSPELKLKHLIKKEKYRPIEEVYDRIDKIAVDNSSKAIASIAREAPGKILQQPNCCRMTFGDINYLSNNKAILYFDRGTEGKQIFTNSVHSLKSQPPYKDLVIVDDIVFTAPCKCDSALQRKKMFPHFKATCAMGLKCPAKLNSYERIAFARNKNTLMGYDNTTLIRYW